MTDREAVLAAIAEHDDLGRERFLDKYGFGPARAYVLVHNGREYDSKAIAGAALAYQRGVMTALLASEFSGGQAGAAARLRQLGFRVEARAEARPAEHLTPAAIQAAIEEFHALGREAFLARYRAHRAERYVIIDAGQPVDAKAIIQAAWTHQHPDAAHLEGNDFRGDRTTVAEPLRNLGFWVDDLTSAPEETAPLGPDPDAYIDAARRIVGPLDRPTQTTSRVEQQLLRGALGLYTAGVGECDLCGLHLPTRLLIAAHIKKRAVSSPEERRDVPHIAIRACLLGCDVLFERGWLWVTEDGRLDAHHANPAAGDLGQILDSRRGRALPCATPERQAYFAWHRGQASPRFPG